eukprot:TRINITY_DN15490_c0_g1_i1.p1 TRINITY_DN15490_c0_g1~~TRINITY_DN15490_c0_g1_i1.p1  ORF type:complete len:445 (-),score=62.94 TRINITY_DN15490_c0_g1_i1:34-1368(-)
MAHKKLSRVVGLGGDQDGDEPTVEGAVFVQNHGTSLLQRLQRRGLTSCGDVLIPTKLELINTVDLDGETIIDPLLQCVSRCVAPPVSTVMQLWKTREKERQGSAVPTGLHHLDNRLRRGIPRSSVTEVVGPAGVGKTQFCHQMAAIVALPAHVGGGWEAAAVYIDTEGSFSAKRLLELASERFPAHFDNEPDALTALASRVTVFRPQSSTELLELLASLEEFIVEKGVGIIILDSVASIARRDFSSRSLVGRQAQLAKQASMLKYYAEAFNIPVVVTNQVTTALRRGGNVDAQHEFSGKARPPQARSHPYAIAQTRKRKNNGGDDSDAGGDGDDEISSSYVTAALGTLWAHAVNTRLVLEYTDMEPSDGTTSFRSLTVAKSPLSAVTSIHYHVTKSGLEEVDVSEHGVSAETEAVGNFWDRHIRDGRSSQPGTQARQQHTAVLY